MKNLKSKTLFLLLVPLTIDEIDAVFLLLGNVPVERFPIIALIDVAKDYL